MLEPVPLFPPLLHGRMFHLLFLTVLGIHGSEQQVCCRLSLLSCEPRTAPHPAFPRHHVPSTEGGVADGAMPSPGGPADTVLSLWVLGGRGGFGTEMLMEEKWD